MIDFGRGSMKWTCMEGLSSTLFVVLLLAAISLSFGWTNQTFGANVNNIDVSQTGISNSITCDLASCLNSLALTQVGAVPILANVLATQTDVTNSIEIEQLALQLNNDCDFIADCLNTAAQVQVLPIAAVVNVLDNQLDVTNSAEIEQFALQLN